MSFPEPASQQTVVKKGLSENALKSTVSLLCIPSKPHPPPLQLGGQGNLWTPTVGKGAEEVAGPLLYLSSWQWP